MTRTLRLLVLAMATLALLAACDDDDAGDDLEAPTTTVAPADDTDDTTDETDDTVGDDTTGAAALQVETTDDFGDVLRDGDGFALYAFTDDTETTSACEDDCADLWPPLEGDAAAVTVGEGLDEALVGSITREDDGSSQVTYGGHLLYYYTPDEEPGDANGQGIGGKWFQVMADGSLAM